jgi:transposase
MQTVATHPPRMLYVAFELGNTEWLLAFATRLEDAPLLRAIPARALPQLEVVLAQAKAQLGCAATAPVHSCYEAGRDGFWLHRYLLSRDIQNVVIDSSSIEVNRRQRRAKTDRLDARKLVTMLMRAVAGERRVWHVVRVPSVMAEDRRQVHRELLTARRDRARLTNRIKGVLASHGVPLPTLATLPTHLATARVWDGTPLPPHCVARLTREWALVELRGVGPDSAWLYVMEFFAWRQFRNRREVGGLAGLTDTPYQSGDVAHQQGISKAGNRWVRALAINTAWAWLRYQPQSALARWYRDKFGHGASRRRKVGIVALARKLLIAFWRYLETGTVPEGAVLRA